MDKKNELTFEQALLSLEEIVEELNNGELDLEKAISAYERGVKLKNICEKRLKNAKERIEQIKLVEDSED
tara:strand:+ start:343 stop:552 length:210 start_codon:yes stop_codon:yes gene_type:complete